MTEGNRRTRLLAKCRKFVDQSQLELKFYIIKPVLPFFFSWQQEEKRKKKKEQNKKRYLHGPDFIHMLYIHKWWSENPLWNILGKKYRRWCTEDEQAWIICVKNKISLFIEIMALPGVRAICLGLYCVLHECNYIALWLRWFLQFCVMWWWLSRLHLHIGS